MRAFTLAAFVLLAAPALAQPVLDGKATLSGATAEAVAKGVATREQMRAVIVAAISDKLQAEETDFFNELAAGSPVDVAVDGKTSRVGPVAGEALGVVKLIVAPPNLNTLWKSQGEPMRQMLEMSRWGDAGRNRITGFMGNKLYLAWTKSSVMNAYTAWVSEFAGVNNAIMAIADPAEKTEARMLLKAAIEQVLASCKTDGREPPQAFLYNFALESVGQPKLP